MMQHRWWMAITGIIVSLIGCAAPLHTQTPVRGKTLNCRLPDVRFNGVGRTYRLHIPKGYSDTSPLPLVVMIHGAFRTAKEMETVTGFSRLADREGFFVLYPDGIGILGFVQHWNAGHCCGKAAADQVDDIGFIWSAVEDAAAHVAIDFSRIYVVGFSNGGMLTHRIGAEMAPRIAAICPIAGAMGGKASPEDDLWTITVPPKSSPAPLPVLIMHGRQDSKVPYNGGPAGGKSVQREYLSVEDAVTFWTDYNHCTGTVLKKNRYAGAVEVETWPNCHGDATVTLMSFRDVGHHWPQVDSTNEDAEDTDRPFDAAEAIWRFLKPFHRSPSVVEGSSDHEPV